MLALVLTAGEASGQDIGGAFVGAGLGNAGIEAATAPLESVVSEENAPPLIGPRAVRARFDYTASPQLRRKTAARLSRQLGTSENDRATLYAQFASDGFHDQVRQGLAPYGLDPQNLADAYAFWWINAWDAAQGQTSETSRTQALAVRDQVLRALAGAGVALDDAEKQRLAEEFVIHGVVFADQLDTASDDPQAIGQLSEVARQAGLRITGLDPRMLKLTDKGFVPSQPD